MQTIQSSISTNTGCSTFSAVYCAELEAEFGQQITDLVTPLLSNHLNLIGAEIPLQRRDLCAAAHELALIRCCGCANLCKALAVWSMGMP
jgi:hypothetical protein